MQLQFLVAVLVACLVHTVPTAAIPTRRTPNPNPGMITMPLKRLQSASGAGVHPQLLLQQHINRSQRRLARMAGRAEPSDDELRENLKKRMFILESGPGSRVPQSSDNAAVSRSNFSRRRFRSGMAMAQGDESGGHRGKHANGGAGVGAGSGAMMGGAGGMNGTMGNATMTSGNGTSSGNGTAAGNSTSSGVAEIDIQAAINGGLTPANKPTANNSLGLDIEADDTGYVATIQIGTPPQDFKILMDSGSADFWVGSQDCQSQNGGGCGNHTFLGTSSSSSFVQSNHQFQVTYGSGAVAGVLCQDNVNIAGLALNNHTFGVALEETVQFSGNTTAFDGLMGLAQSTLSEQNVSTPVESLASQGLIASAITSFKISRLSDGLNDGEVTFGGLDASKFVASSLVTFPNVNQLGFWEGAVDAITVNGTDSGLSGRTAILDTGTTLILAPAQDATAIHQMLGGSCDQQQCTISCTTASSLALSFGNASFAIDPRDLAVLPLDPNDPTGDCMSGIQAGSVGGANEWLVGDVFLKNAYFSTDVSKNQISLAKLTTS
ncbi:acid protease [Hygrophoropsis aurantiaca]|uniref:Acid protease n=1 Tax=Hygrophoropsis aurantiaca TaxID=72124 RepID=A0ACB8AD68_9AGAM|nr:acid protease [Hygrophoropsis aurantiaca]